MGSLIYVFPPGKVCLPAFRNASNGRSCCVCNRASPRTKKSSAAEAMSEATESEPTLAIQLNYDRGVNEIPCFAARRLIASSNVFGGAIGAVVLCEERKDGLPFIGLGTNLDRAWLTAVRDCSATATRSWVLRTFAFRTSALNRLRKNSYLPSGAPAFAGTNSGSVLFFVDSQLVIAETNSRCCCASCACCAC